MKPIRTTILAALAAALSLAAAAPAFADNWKHEGRHWKQHDRHYGHGHRGHDHRHGRRHVQIHEYYYAPAPVYYPPVVAYPAYPGRPQVVVSVPPIVVGF